MIAPEPIAERRGLKGQLHLVAAPDHRGLTQFREQSFSAPFHLSKAFQENGVLVANVINPTAGLFRSDATRASIRVESGARLLLTTPSATRVFNTQGGRSVAEQLIQVEPNAWLEILPELFIPHLGARHRQTSRIVVEDSGELCFLETLAPGRVASGEIFVFEQLDWKTEIFHGGRLVVRERFVLSAPSAGVRALLKFSAHPYVATFFIITPRLSADSRCWGEIDSLQGVDTWIGTSGLVGGGFAIRLVTPNSIRLRECVGFIRSRLHLACGWTLPTARKM